MEIISVVGARPQFIKAAVVSRALRSQPGLTEVLVHTGQHYDSNMSQQFFAELQIAQPDYHLGVGSGRHGEQTGRMLGKLEEVFLERKPDWVLVYGDTNSTLAGALAAAKLSIPVAHVEAGLRSFNRLMPEEINRIMTDHLSDLLFAPTEVSVRNLAAEGIDGPKVERVGDVMYDAARLYGNIAEETSTVLSRLSLAPREYVLATIHRAENTDAPDRLAAIWNSLRALGRSWKVVVPLHPRTTAALDKAGIRALEQSDGSFIVTAPLGYLDMLKLERNAAVILTDSGGVQKEAFFQGTPCVTLRNETEWIELVISGWNRLCPSERLACLPEVVREAAGTQGSELHCFGEGNAAKLIAGILASRHE